MKSKIILLVLLSLAACGKEEETSLQVNFRFKAGNDDFQYNTPYLINGTKTEFTTVKFYVSEPSFTTEEGETFTLSETYFLVSPNSEACEMKIKPGKYSWFRFGLGVNPSRNDSSGALAIPAYEYPVAHPLSPAADMYWAWNPGYIFIKLEGRVDIDGDGLFAGTNETFSIHTGLNPCYKIISRPMPIELESGSEKNMFIPVNVSAFFNGFDLTSSARNAHPFSVNSPEFPAVQIITENAEYVFGNISEE